MPTYQLYIGANNDTGQIETDKIEQIVAAHHDGFTLQMATGYWQGAKEPSALVTISDDQRAILATAHELKLALNQQAIAMQQTNDMEFI